MSDFFSLFVDFCRAEDGDVCRVAEGFFGLAEEAVAVCKEDWGDGVRETGASLL